MVSCRTGFRGWARSACGEAAQGTAWIEEGIENYRATGSMLDMPFLLALKAEALHLADRTSDALEAEVLQLCRPAVIGWLDAPSGLFGLWPVQVAPV
jgi:hypothetical protein